MMQRLAFFLLGLLALDPVAVSATKVVQCKTTYRGKLKEPGVADHRSLCTLYTNIQDNSDMCVTTDTRGDNSGYYSVADNTSTICVTLIYKEKNDLFGVDGIVLYRGLSQLTGVKTCNDVCIYLNGLISNTTKIHYVGCVPIENGNDEEVDKISYNSPTSYTCKTPNNYAKPGDPDRPGAPAPIPTRPTATRPSTTTIITTKGSSTTSTPTMSKPTTATTIPGPITTSKITISETVTTSNSGPTADLTTPGDVTNTIEPPTGQTSPDPDTTVATSETTSESTPSGTDTSVVPSPTADAGTTESPPPSDTSVASDSTVDSETSESSSVEPVTTESDTLPTQESTNTFEFAEFVAGVVGSVAEAEQKIQTRDEAQTSQGSSPSWTWPIIGSLIGLLALMVVALAVELVIARMIFKEVAKVGVTNDMPLS